VEWTQQEEAKYQAALLAAEVEALDGRKEKHEEGGDKKRGKSPKPTSRCLSLFLIVNVCCWLQAV